MGVLGVMGSRHLTGTVKEQRRETQRKGEGQSSGCKLSTCRPFAVPTLLCVWTGDSRISTMGISTHRRCGEGD
jgi:hypothetical protein